MYILNLSNSIAIILIIIALIIFIYLAKILKKSKILIMPMIAFLAVLISYIIQLKNLTSEYKNYTNIIYKSMLIDIVFTLIILVAFIALRKIEMKKRLKIK